MERGARQEAMVELAEHPVGRRLPEARVIGAEPVYAFGLPAVANRLLSSPISPRTRAPT